MRHFLKFCKVFWVTAVATALPKLSAEYDLAQTLSIRINSLEALASSDCPFWCYLYAKRNTRYLHNTPIPAKNISLLVGSGNYSAV